MEKENQKDLLKKIAGMCYLEKPFQLPFIYQDFICATDNHQFIFLNVSEFETEICNNVKLMMGNANFEINDNIITAIDKIIQLGDGFKSSYEDEKIITISKNQLKDFLSLKTEEQICTDCNGTGKLTYSYQSLAGRLVTTTGECPFCQGNGKIQKKNKCYFQVNEQYLFPFEKFKIPYEILNNSDLEQCHLIFDDNCPQCVKISFEEYGWMLIALTIGNVNEDTMLLSEFKEKILSKTITLN